MIIAISVCCMAAMAATRMLFAMARDSNIPRQRLALALSTGGRKTPIGPNVLIAAVAIVILLVNIRQPQIILVVTSLVVALYYVAYLLVTAPFWWRACAVPMAPAKEGPRLVLAGPVGPRREHPRRALGRRP